RPLDIWRERVFIPSPCGAPPVRGIVTGTTPVAADRAGTGQPGAGRPGAAAAPADARGTAPGRPAPAADGSAGTTLGPGARPAARHPAPTGKGPAAPGTAPARPGTKRKRTGAPQPGTAQAASPASTAASGHPAAPPAGQKAADTAGAGSWVRCFTEHLHPV